MLLLVVAEKKFNVEITMGQLEPNPCSTPFALPVIKVSHTAWFKVSQLTWTKFNVRFHLC